MRNTSKKFTIKTPKIVARATIYSAVSIILVGALIFSVYNIIKWRAESDANLKQIQDLQSKTEITEVSTVLKIQNNVIPATDPYWTAQDASLIDVDLTESRNLNSDIFGWVRVSGTNIDYPFAQTTDNEYYLFHSFNKSWTDAGWVFLDYRNDKNFTDKNHILYAHGRLDGTMFGSLKNILTPEWQNNTDNHVIKISTVNSNSNWQVFSVYQIPVTTDYLTTNFASNTEFEAFLDLITKRSVYDFKTKLTSSDRILTLSTCGENNTRVVLHARLLKTIQKAQK